VSSPYDVGVCLEQFATNLDWSCQSCTRQTPEIWTPEACCRMAGYGSCKHWRRIMHRPGVSWCQVRATHKNRRCQPARNLGLIPTDWVPEQPAHVLACVWFNVPTSRDALTASCVFHHPPIHLRLRIANVDASLHATRDASCWLHMPSTAFHRNHPGTHETITREHSALARLGLSKPASTQPGRHVLASSISGDHSCRIRSPSEAQSSYPQSSDAK
jgi:hypothetical protein